MRMRLGRWRAALLPGRLLPTLALRLLTGLAVLAIVMLTWRWLEEKSNLIQYLALLVALASFIAIFFGPFEPPRGRVFWEKLQANGRWQAGLGVLAVGLWAIYFLWSGPVRLPSGVPTTYTVENLCALATEYPSDGALRAALTAQAKAEAQARFGGNQQTRQLGTATFENGQSLGQVCIRVTFDNGVAGE